MGRVERREGDGRREGKELTTATAAAVAGNGAILAIAGY